MGVVVVFILISLYLPIFSLGSAAGRRTGLTLYMADTTITVPHWADGRRPRRARPGRSPGARYRAEFVDLKNFKIQHDLLRTVPVELMFRYNFVPIEQHQDAMVIAVSDPSRLMVLDEIAGLLGHRIIARVATLSQITDLLKKTEQSQRVLDEASEGLTFDVLTGDENSDENISIEKLTSEKTSAPSSAWSTPRSSLHSSAAPPTSTSRPTTTRCTSSTASTASCRKPWRLSRASITPPFSAASRS